MIPVGGAVPLTFLDPTYSHASFLHYFAMYYFSCCYATLASVGFIVRYRQRQNADKEHDAPLGEIMHQQVSFGSDVSTGAPT
jgi:hypothetical protein